MHTRHEPTPTPSPEPETSRRRSSSEPQRPQWLKQPDALPPPARGAGVTNAMPPIRELSSSETQEQPLTLNQIAQLNAQAQPTHEGGIANGGGRFRRASVAARSALRRRPVSQGNSAPTGSVNADEEEEYNNRLVDVLDTIDPEVSTLSTLTNVQNSLFIPNLGLFVNRRPTYTLNRYPNRPGTAPGRPTPVPVQPPAPEPPEPEPEPELEQVETREQDETVPRPPLAHISTITSVMTESRYAVLPHGKSLEGWSAAEKDELNDHVRHALHSRREAFKRSMQGFGQYVRRPLGFLVTLYATLITLFGLAWVLFLIGWIDLGSRRLYIINVIDNVLVALFAVMGDGLAPFRAVDTYHMVFIAHYHHVTMRRRRKRQLPELEDHNDLPEKREEEVDIEKLDSKDSLEEFSVLNPEQQRKLMHHQTKFSRSHTFYKPHETETHFAFPLHLLVAIVILLDCHSLLQIALGTCTWAIDYHVRPFALTTVILCCSITCNITAGVIIMVGDRKTRKKDVLERMFRQELTDNAIKKIEKKRAEREQQEKEEQERASAHNSNLALGKAKESRTSL
ncbi:hypothetical protein EJ06DRAFT_558448 [Trichodelitschia bisporula]|uniref:Integral membrane protein n=1 Tax=Trichodelitschia bisporula TaxID=703511 RepID=A0A6G1HQ62_9PEZI|nr:hypothetical protein EJ06DRAFT_558448 [Trichodelitschia bisporula]